MRKWEFRKRRKKDIIIGWRARVKGNAGSDEDLRWKVRRRKKKKMV